MTLLDALAASRQAQYSAETEMGNEHAQDLFTKLISATDGDTKYALEPPEVVLYVFLFLMENDTFQDRKHTLPSVAGNGQLT